MRSGPQFIEKEDNMRIANVLVDFLTTDSVKLHPIDFEDPDISDYNMIPNSVLLSDRLRVCLQESDEVPTDFTRLFNTRLFSISTSLVPPAIKGSQSVSLSIFGEGALKKLGLFRKIWSSAGFSFKSPYVEK